MNLIARTRQALSMIEVSITLVIFSLLMSMVGQSLVMGVQMNDLVVTNSDLIEDGNRVLSKISSYLRTADYNYILLPDDGSGDVTCTFNLCTGLAVSGPKIDEKKLRLFYDKSERTITATLYDTTASDTEEGKWVTVQTLVASSLAENSGLEIVQLGTDATYVKGNRLQIVINLAKKLENGQTVVHKVSTVIYLRSTIYYKDDILASLDTTQVVSVETPDPSDPTGEVTTTETVTGPTPDAATLVMGPDTDSSQTKNTDGSVKSSMIVVVDIQVPKGSKLQSSSVTADQDTLEAIQFSDTQWKLTGYVQGSVTLTAIATVTQGKETFTTTATRLY